MDKIYSTKSSAISLFMNIEIFHILNPWRITVDLKKETITVAKRNWYLIGTDENIIAFRFIRNINIDEHAFGGNIYIRAIGGSVSAKYFSKKSLNHIKNVLIEYNMTKKHHIIFS